MKIDTNSGTLRFKSLPVYYHSEKLGAKANTVRTVTYDEYDEIMACAPETIVITNDVTGESFKREISSIVEIPPMINISLLRDETLIIVSWWS